MAIPAVCNLLTRLVILPCLVTALTACGGAATRPPVVPRSGIAEAQWLRLARAPGGEIAGSLALPGGPDVALVADREKDAVRWLVVVADGGKGEVVPVVTLPTRDTRPHLAKATLTVLRVGGDDLVRADVAFVEEQAPHGFATRTVLVTTDGPPRVVLDRLSEVGTDSAQKRAKVSAADVDGDGSVEIVFDEQLGAERRKVVYRLEKAGYQTRDRSLFQVRPR
jgi:hypothetical protein